MEIPSKSEQATKNPNLCLQLLEVQRTQTHMVLFALFQDVVIYKWSPPKIYYLIFLNKYI